MWSFYQGYLALYRYEEGLYQGHVLNCPDTIRFKGYSPAEIEQAFQEAVDLYLATCRAKGYKPNRQNVT